VALRDWEDVGYMPVLSVRPSEMRALEELPNRTKDELFPIIQLGPWANSHQFQNTLDRVAEAYGDRPIVAALGFPGVVRTRRPVHEEIDRLRSPRRGFENWCEFIEEHDNFVPAIQFGPAEHEEGQIESLAELGRGLVVVIEPPAFDVISELSSRVADLTDGGADVCFVLDYLRASRDHLQVSAATVRRLNRVLEAAPNAYVAVSASSFPENFVNVTEQPIYERRLFDEVAAQVGDRLIYSDRGSARVERQQGGGGTPSPRIDYPVRRDWHFYRSEDRPGFPGYRQQARALMAEEEVWNSQLRVWGTQMIERTAAGDSSAISNPARSTAARINIHLQVQSYYDDPEAAFETEEDWED
jgi:hypothetical protein